MSDVYPRYQQGWHPPYQPTPYVLAPPPTSGLATTSLVLGLISIAGGFCLLGIPCALAVIFGHMARRETKNGGRGGNGMAVAGLILGYLSLLPWVLFGVQLIVGLAAMELEPSVNQTP